MGIGLVLASLCAVLRGFFRGEFQIDFVKLARKLLDKVVLYIIV
jgi:hypothetical protein